MINMVHLKHRCLHICMPILTAVIGTNTGIFNGFAKSPEIHGVTIVICTFVAAVMFTMIQKMDTGLKPEQPSDKSDDSQKPNLDMFR